MSYAIPEDHTPRQPHHTYGVAPQHSERLCCSICTRALDGDKLFLDETGDVPAPRQSWVLCHDCDAAVRTELERSPVQGPLRVRIAVGLVAAERSPYAIRRTKAGLHDDGWLHFMFWVFGVAIFLHLLVIVWIAFLIR